MKLFYFGMKGRAETARLVMKIGGKPFEDVRFSGEEWGAKYKALSPSGQCPWMELDDGKVVTQSNAIAAYCAAQAGLLPGDPVELARTLELQYALEDMFTPVLATFGIADAEEKAAARKALCEPDGAMSKKLKNVDKIVAAAAGEYFCGDEPTLADYHLFVFLGNLRSGVLDGISKEFIDSFENLAALRSKVASLEKVKAMYDENDPGYEP